MTVNLNTFLNQLRVKFGDLPVINACDFTGGAVAREIRFLEDNLAIIRQAGAEVPELLEDPLDAAGREKSFRLLVEVTAGDVFQQFHGNLPVTRAIIRLHRNIRRIKDAINDDRQTIGRRFHEDHSLKSDA